MKLSPAPTQPQRPDCAACSSALGAGVQFARLPCVERVFGIVARLLMYGRASVNTGKGLIDVPQPGVNIAERRFQSFATDLIHGMRVKERDCLPAKTMQNRYRVGGIQRRWVWIGTVGPVKDGHANAGLGAEWHGQAWQHVTPRHGGNFSGLAIASLVWARQCSAGRGNNATRSDIAGQFPCHASTGHAMAQRGVAAQQRELGAASKRNFPGSAVRCEARPGSASRSGAGMGYTLPRAESGTISQGMERSGWAWQCEPRLGNNVTGDGNPGHFPKHQEAPASRGATVQGMTGNV